jgi:hypothetical protein
VSVFLVFLALGLLVWAVNELLDDAEHRDARRRNRARRIR